MMPHICGDEIMALMALFPSLMLAWLWLKSKFVKKSADCKCGSPHGCAVPETGGDENDQARSSEAVPDGDPSTHSFERQAGEGPGME